VDGSPSSLLLFRNNTSMDHPSNIVPIDEESDKLLQVTLADQERWHKCIRRHEHILVDEKNRYVQCQDCGAMLDPFDLLLSAAKKGQHVWDWVDHLEAKRSTLEGLVHVLEKRLESVRGKLKREGHPQDPREKWEFSSMVLNPASAKTKEFLEKHAG
jgi:hypothetical protein